MNRESAEKPVGIVRATAVRVVMVTVLLVAFGRIAHADKIDTLIAELDNPSDRVRVSAVLALQSQESPRAIDGLVKRLAQDSDKKVRGLAAAAIGAIVEKGKPTPAQRKTAADALAKAKNDPEPFVAAKAGAALTQVGAAATLGTPSTNSGAGGVYVNLGPMSSKTNTPEDAKYRTLMQKTASSTMSKAAPSMATTWPGKAPTRQQLDKKGVAAFYVDGTLNSVTVVISGNAAKVSCKVNMLLATFPEQSMFGLLNGGAGVQASSSPGDIALAKEDCVAAVVESLIAKQIVPTIKNKVGP